MPDLTGVAQVPHGVNVFYSRLMLIKAVPLLVHIKWAQVKDIPKNNTDVIKFRRYSLLTAATTPLTTGVTPAGSQLEVETITATVRQYGDYITFSDFFLMTTLDPILTENTDILGQQFGNTIDQLTRDILAAGSTIQYASTAGARDEVTAAMKITRLEVKEGVRTLKGNNAKMITSMVDASTGFNTSPLPSCYIGICHTDTTYDLEEVAGFVKVEEYGQKKAMEGEIGTLAKVRFIETTNAKVFEDLGSGGTVDVYATLILGANAYGVSRISGAAIENIVKPKGSGDDPLNQRQTHGWKATFVARILNQNFMLRLEHAVTT